MDPDHVCWWAARSAASLCRWTITANLNSSHFFPQVVTRNDGRRMWVQSEEDLHGAKCSGEIWCRLKGLHHQKGKGIKCMTRLRVQLAREESPWWKRICSSLALKAVVGTVSGGKKKSNSAISVWMNERGMCWNGLWVVGRTEKHHINACVLTIWHMNMFSLWQTIAVSACKCLKFFLSNMLCGKTDSSFYHCMLQCIHYCLWVWCSNGLSVSGLIFQCEDGRHKTGKTKLVILQCLIFVYVTHFCKHRPDV